MLGLIEESAPQASTPVQPGSNQAGSVQPGSNQAKASPAKDGEVSARAKPYLDKAVGLLYDENFENLVAMFKQHGEQGFPEAMSTAVNGVLERLEKDEGEIDVEIIAEVGTQLLLMLAQDMVQGGIIKELNKEMFMGAISMTLGKWGEANPERADPKELQQAAAQADAERGL